MLLKIQQNEFQVENESSASMVAIHNKNTQLDDSTFLILVTLPVIPKISNENILSHNYFQTSIENRLFLQLLDRLNKRSLIT